MHLGLRRLPICLILTRSWCYLIPCERVSRNTACDKNSLSSHWVWFNEICTPLLCYKDWYGGYFVCLFVSVWFKIQGDRRAQIFQMLWELCSRLTQAERKGGSYEGRREGERQAFLKESRFKQECCQQDCALRDAAGAGFHHPRWRDLPSF